MAEHELALAYSNLTGRPHGPLMRAGMLLSRGIRQVQAQVVPYAAAWQSSNRAALERRGPLWVVLGDSMSQGIGASAYDRGWVGQLADQRPGYRVLNLSASGARVGDVLEHQLPVLESLEQSVRPALVTVLIGSNDMMRKRYREALRSDFAAMLDRLPDGSVVANLPGGHAIAQTIDDLISSDRRITVADMRRSMTTSWKGKLAADHFHPNDSGYADMAAVFADVVPETAVLEGN